MSSKPTKMKGVTFAGIPIGSKKRTTKPKKTNSSVLHVTRDLRKRGTTSRSGSRSRSTNGPKKSKASAGIGDINISIGDMLGGGTRSMPVGPSGSRTFGAQIRDLPFNFYNIVRGGDMKQGSNRNLSDVNPNAKSESNAPAINIVTNNNSNSKSVGGRNTSRSIGGKTITRGGTSRGGSVDTTMSSGRYNATTSTQAVAVPTNDPTSQDPNVSAGFQHEVAPHDIKHHHDPALKHAMDIAEQEIPDIMLTEDDVNVEEYSEVRPHEEVSVKPEHHTGMDLGTDNNVETVAPPAIPTHVRGADHPFENVQGGTGAHPSATSGYEPPPSHFEAGTLEFNPGVGLLSGTMKTNVPRPPKEDEVRDWDFKFEIPTDPTLPEPKTRGKRTLLRPPKVDDVDWDPDNGKQPRFSTALDKPGSLRLSKEYYKERRIVKAAKLEKIQNPHAVRKSKLQQDAAMIEWGEHHLSSIGAAEMDENYQQQYV